MTLDITSMTGSKYSYAITHLSEGVIYPDAHMFVQDDFYQYDPDVIATNMTQLTFKSAPKVWGNDAQLAVEAEVKLLHWRNSFCPVHLWDLSPMQQKNDP